MLQAQQQQQPPQRADSLNSRQDPRSDVGSPRQQLQREPSMRSSSSRGLVRLMCSLACSEARLCLAWGRKLVALFARC